MSRYVAIDPSAFDGKAKWILRSSSTFSFDPERLHGGSGMMILPGVVLTATHVVFHLTGSKLTNAKKREWAISTSYYVGADDSTPKSVEKVDPTNLVASFGQGVRLSRATIQLVPVGWSAFDRLGWPKAWAGEPITTGIEKRLPWLDRLNDHSLGGTRLQPATKFADLLGNLDFRRR